MSSLTPRQRLAVLAGLVDGNSERAVERMTTDMGIGVTQKTIGKFALRLGRAAWSLHNTMAHGLAPSLIEFDEVWSYVAKKQARVTPAEHAMGLGEAYTFVGLTMPSRYAITWTVGKRDQVTADAFIGDMRSRIVTMPTMMTSDGFVPYISAIGREFGPGVDYAQVIKNYRKSGRKDDDHRYEPPREPFLTKRAIFGAPNLDAATTAHQERQHGTMRHFEGRMRRLVYAFSKDPEHHKAAVSLCYCYYNLCWTPRTMKKITPAVSIGVTKHVWELEEFLEALLSVPETAPPVKVPLGLRKPDVSARELPNGRGFLRVVKSGGGPAVPSPSPAPATPPPGPAAPVVASVEPAADPTGQLDLLAWRPRPVEPSKRLPPGQLSLFGIEFDPGSKGDQ